MKFIQKIALASLLSCAALAANAAVPHVRIEIEAPTPELKAESLAALKACIPPSSRVWVTYVNNFAATQVAAKIIDFSTEYNNGVVIATHTGVKHLCSFAQHAAGVAKDLAAAATAPAAPASGAAPVAVEATSAAEPAKQ